MQHLKINNKTLYNWAVQIFICALVVFYFTDGIFKVLDRTGVSHYRFGPIVKGLFEALILSFGLITLRKAKVHVFICIIFLIACFLIGQFFLSYRIEKLNFFENLNTLFKYLSSLIFFLLALDVLNFKTYPIRLWKSYKIILTLNSILILIGLIGVSSLQTYSNDFRFGYNGLIYAQNEASYIFILAITTVYYRRYYLGFKELFFWIVIIPSMIVATKAVYLFIILLFLFHVFKKVPLKKIMIFAFFIASLGYILFNSFVNKIFINSWNIFYLYYEKNGLLTALLSGRNTFIDQKLKPLVLDLWSIPNFIFGGQDVVQHDVEMGFINLILFFGLLGTLLYIYIYFKFINLLSFEKEFKLFFILTLGIIIFTSGHFFNSGIAGFHFILFLLINKRINIDYEKTNVENY